MWTRLGDFRGPELARRGPNHEFHLPRQPGISACRGVWGGRRGWLRGMGKASLPHGPPPPNPTHPPEPANPHNGVKPSGGSIGGVISPHLPTAAWFPPIAWVGGFGWVGRDWGRWPVGQGCIAHIGGCGRDGRGGERQRPSSGKPESSIPLQIFRAPVMRRETACDLLAGFD